MISYSQSPVKKLSKGDIEIASFVHNDGNLDPETVKSFGEEWQKFGTFAEQDLSTAGSQYFDIVDDQVMNKSTIALDVGCGTGRWSKYIAKHVHFIEAIDPSNAVYAAANFLGDTKNARVTQASVDNIPFPDSSFDFVFSLGVLHHLPDTAHAMKKCVSKVKPGGIFLVYLYYNLDNRGPLFKVLFKLSNLVRKVVSLLPQNLKFLICDLLAVVFYMPFVTLARVIQHTPFLKQKVHLIPLSYYRDKSFRIIRNDALDRFGTPLEKRFSRKEVKNLMEEAGLTNIKFSEKEPYWHATGVKKA
ncbi:class I SAM-dependent methyltransferase [Cytophagaceae bacterium ABcell3]|nr:class I SAM-dependent methyltransferase [Cytophagaceae bacterium ABcell3]